MVENLINEIKKGSFKEYLKGNDTEIIKELDNEIYQIATLASQLNSENISTINLGDCEEKLKSSNNIASDEDLIIFKIAHLLPEFKTQILEYSIYSLEGDELDLNSCGDSTIRYDIPIDIDEKDLYKYNPNDDFYNDICFQYSSDNGTDLTQYDRKNEFNEKKLSLCENNCEFIEYKKDIKKAICDCKIKKDFNNFDELDKNELIKKFSNYKKIFNIEIIKCYKLLFTKGGLVSNIGSYIILTIIFIHIVCCFIFCFYGYKAFFNRINKILNIDLKHNIPKQKNINSKKKRNVKSKKKKSNPTKKTKSIKLNKNRKNKKVLSKSSSQTKSINNLNNNLITNNNPIFNTKTKIERNDYELNALTFEEAIINDKRTFCQYYLALIRLKQLLIFTFYTRNDYNSRIIKISSFFTSFALSYSIKALFFNDSVMHVIYINNGVYDIIEQLPQIVYSTIISSIIGMILSFISLTQVNVIQIKKIKREMIDYKNTYEKNMNFIKIKFILFFVVNFSLLILFWFYLSSFCAVYKNTQKYLLKDALISFGFTLIYPFFINLLPCIFRIYSLSSPKKKRKYSYILSKLLQLI